MERKSFELNVSHVWPLILPSFALFECIRWSLRNVCTVRIISMLFKNADNIIQNLCQVTLLSVGVCSS